MVGNKSPALFVKKPLCKGDLLPAHKIFVKRPVKVSVSMLQVHSICTALLAKHVKSAPYLLSSILPSFVRDGPNISMPQLVNGGPSMFCCLVGLPSSIHQVLLSAISI